MRIIDSDLLTRVNPPNFDGAADIADLTYLNEASVVHNLRVRYQKGEIYVSRGHPELKLRWPLFPAVALSTGTTDVVFVDEPNLTDILGIVPRRCQPVPQLADLYAASRRRCVRVVSPSRIATNALTPEHTPQRTREHEEIRTRLTSTPWPKRPGRTCCISATRARAFS